MTFKGDSIQGPLSIATYLLETTGKRPEWLGTTLEDKAAIADAATSMLHSVAERLKLNRTEALMNLNELLSDKVFLVGSALTLADIALYGLLYDVPFRQQDITSYPNVIRFVDTVQHVVQQQSPDVSLRLIPFDLNVAFPIATEPQIASKATGDAAKDKKKSNKQAAATEVACKKEEVADEPANGLPDPSKLDIRIGTILAVEKHPDAETLYVEKVELGEDKPRTVVSGLVKYMTEDQLLNRQVVLLCNLKPAKMRGVESQAMVLATTSVDGTVVELLDPPSGSSNGDVAYFESYKGVPEKQLNSKKKVWENIYPNLQTNVKRQAVYIVPDDSEKQCVLRTDKGIITVKTVIDGSIK